MISLGITAVLIITELVIPGQHLFFEIPIWYSDDITKVHRSNTGPKFIVLPWYYHYDFTWYYRGSNYYRVGNTRSHEVFWRVKWAKTNSLSSSIGKMEANKIAESFGTYRILAFEVR